MPDRIDPALLTRSWTHAHEEDTGSEAVFRPSDFKFAPSRGRRSLQFEPNGKLLDMGTGADDRPTGQAGSWRLSAPDTLEIEPQGTGGPTREMKVLSLSSDKLVLAK